MFIYIEFVEAAVYKYHDREIVRVRERKRERERERKREREIEL